MRLVLNFEVPAQGVPTDETIDALSMGRYDGVEGTGTVTAASIVIREDEAGALGSYQATVEGLEGPNGTISFGNGVYYTGEIKRP